MNAPRQLMVLAEVLRSASDDRAGECAEAVQRVIDGEVDGLDAAFDLKRGAGERSWRTEASLRNRDEQLRAAATDFGLLPVEIANGLASYAGNGWKRDRDAASCPARIEGKPEGRYWRALKAKPWPIVGARQVRAILRGGNELPVFTSADPLQNQCDSKRDPSSPARKQELNK